MWRKRRANVNGDARARALVAAQFLALGVLALPERRRRRSRRRRALGWGLIVGGGALAAAGAAALGPDLRPLPLPRAGATLRSSGPYARLRHPIYAGIFTAAVGRTIATGGRRHALATVGLGAILSAKARLEEKLLRSEERRVGKECTSRWWAGR